MRSGVAEGRCNETVAEDDRNPGVGGGVIVDGGNPLVDGLLDIEFENACRRTRGREMHVGLDKAGQHQLSADVADYRFRPDVFRCPCRVTDVDKPVIANDCCLGPGSGLVDRVYASVEQCEITRRCLWQRRTGDGPEQGGDQECVTHNVRYASLARRSRSLSAGCRPADGQKGPR